MSTCTHIQSSKHDGVCGKAVGEQAFQLQARTSVKMFAESTNQRLCGEWHLHCVPVLLVLLYTGEERDDGTDSDGLSYDSGRETVQNEGPYDDQRRQSHQRSDSHGKDEV